MKTIGRHTSISDVTGLETWLPSEDIVIGNFCSIARNVIILTGGLHRTQFATTFPLEIIMLGRTIVDRVYQTTRNTVIGNDVWIATGAIILGGSRVGDGAVVGAGSVVHGKIPPYAVVSGNPAEIMFYRFSPETIQRLLKIAWWDWTDEFITENLEWFYRPVQDFIQQFDPPMENR